MAERDMSGEAVVRAAKIGRLVKKKVSELLPYGPGRVRLTPAEFRKSMRRTSMDTVARVLEQLGPDEFLRLMQADKSKLQRLSDIDRFVAEE